MKLSKEAKLGLIIFTGIALLFWGLNFLKGKDFFSSDKLIYAVYNDVEGLSGSNPVVLSGLKVGSVRSLKLTEDESGRIIVSLHITNRVHIPNNSIAQIFSTDLLGSKGIKIIRGDSKVELKDNDTLMSSVQQGISEQISAQVAPIKAKTESVLSSMDSILLTLRAVFNERTKQNLSRSFESISRSMASIEGITGSLDTALRAEGKLRVIFDNLASITNNLKNNNENIQKMIANFTAISDTIAKSKISETLENTRKTLDQTAGIMGKINKGEGTLGQLATNDSLYHNLNSTARDLDMLLTDLRVNPGRYIKLSLISFGSSKK